MAEEWLDGLRVIDLSRLLPGPFCSLLLADMGADVVKVEAPGGGDYARYYPPMVGEFGAFFGALNRNKRSITLNLKAEEGADVLRRMVEEADVLLESFRPGVMDRLGVGYEALAEINPSLVYCAISGYGQDGPFRDRAGHDMNYMARAGQLYQNGGSDSGPVVPGFQVADIAGGALYAGLGILGALFGRERSGEGAFVDISMTDGALSFGLPTFAGVDAGMPAPRGEGMLTGGVACYNIYETSDGRYLSVGSLEPKFWAKVCHALEMPDMIGDALDMGASGEETRQRVSDAIAQKTLAEWMAIFEPIDACVEPVLTPEEVLEDELFRARERFFELAGVRHTRTPLTPVDREHSPPPSLGEHTEEILTDLGYDAPDIEELRDADAL